MQGQSGDPVVKLQQQELMLRTKEIEYDKLIAIAKLQMEEIKIMVDDLNTDLDREADLKIARIRGGKSGKSS